MAFEAVSLWLATKHKYPAGQACGILESRRLDRQIVRATWLDPKVKRPKVLGVAIGQAITWLFAASHCDMSQRLDQAVEGVWDVWFATLAR